MEQELNIAAILKDKPKGTKLWTPVIGNCKLMEVFMDGLHQQHIIVYNEVDNASCSASFTDKGKLYSNGECLLFPSKKMQDWSKFAWKLGDILINGNSIVVFKRWLNDSYTKFCGVHEIYQSQTTKRYIESESEYKTCDYEREFDNNKIKAYLCDIEHETGGKLNLETLEIEKSVPQFKDGDIVFVEGTENYCNYIEIFNHFEDGDICDHASYDIEKSKLDCNGYYNIGKDEYQNIRLATESEKQQLFDALAKEGKRWNSETKTLEDLPKKCELKAFDKVLVRHGNDCYWGIDIFSNYGDEYHDEYQCLTDAYEQCLPYNEKTAHLLGTTDGYEEGGEG